MKNNNNTYNIDDYISRLSAELSIDAVGLWQLVTAGRNIYNLSSGELVSFVRKGIVSLVDAGALPVSSDKFGRYYWNVDGRYGGEKNAIADNVVREWLSTNNEDDMLWSLWFATPEIFNKPRVLKNTPSNDG